MLKRIVKSTLVVIACLLVLICFLPMLVSVSKVNQFLLSCVNSRISGKLHAQEIRVGWTDGICVTGLKIHDPQGREVALFNKISCDVALLSLIHAPAIEGTIQVDSPKINLIDDKNTGHFSIEQVFSPETAVKSPAPSQNTPQTELIVSDLHLSIDIHPQGQAKVQLACQVKNTDNGSVEKGSVNLAATAQNFADLERAYKSALGQISNSAASVVTLDCHIDQFPLKAIVPFVAIANYDLSKLILPALGNTINAKISHTLKGDELGLSLLLNSPQLTTKLRAQIKGKQLTIQDEGSVNWEIRPDVLACLKMSFPQIPADLEQAKPTTLQATIQPYSGTLGTDGKMPLAINWSLDSPLLLNKASWNDTLAMQLQGNLTATSLQESLEANTTAQISLGKQLSTLNSLCTVNQPLTKQETSCKLTLNGPIASQAELFLPQSLPLVELLGTTTNLEATCKNTATEKTGQLQIQSDTMQANMFFTVANDILKMQPSTISMKISPQAIAAYIPQEKGISTTSIPLTVNVAALEIPLTSKALVKETLLDVAVNLKPFFVANTLHSIGVNDTAIKIVKPKGQDLVLTTNGSLNLAKASALYQQIAGETLNFNANIPVHFDGDKITLTNVRTELQPQSPNAALQKLLATLSSNINIATREIDGKVALVSNTTSLNTTFSARPEAESEYTVLPAYTLSLDGSMKDFPVLVLEALSEKPGLTELLGTTLSGSWKLALDNSLSKKPMAFSLTGDGLTLQTNLQLAKTITANSAQDAATIDWQITPKRFKALQKMLQLAQSEKQKDMQLQDDVHLTVHVKGLQLPLEQFVQNQKPLVLGAFLDALALDAQIALGAVTLSQKDKKPLSIAPLHVTAALIGKDRTVSFTCNTENSAQKEQAQLAITGSASNLWNDQDFQFDNARILVDTKIQNLPLDILYSFTAMPDTADKVISMLGHTLNANLKGDIKDLQEGSCHGNIQSPLLKSEIACLVKDGKLTLEKPITAEYTLSPETGARSESPIKFAIDSKDFSVVLKPFSLKTIQAKNIKIEPGILYCKNIGMLSLLVNLFKVKSSDETTVWTTPVYIEIKDGIVHCKRADALLANTFPVATWGKIDLVKNSLDMTLGLSGTSLTRAFDIPKLDPSYMVQIPIRGTIQSPKIDTALVTTKLTALKLMQTRSSTTSIIGGLLDVATTIVDKESPAPAPTTHPFPWKLAKN